MAAQTITLVKRMHHGTISGGESLRSLLRVNRKLLCGTNEITTAEKKCTVLLSSCEMVTYKVIRRVLAPSMLTEVSYNDLTGEFSPRPLPIMHLG